MRDRLLKWLARDYVAALERGFDERVDRRVAKVLSERDPFEPLLQHFAGTFSQEYQRVEEPLDQYGQTAMKLWGYQQAHDPAFIRITDWVMNKAGNQLIQKGLPSVERQLFARAQISTMLLLRKEAGRLGSLYEEMMNRGDEFISDSLVD